MHIDSSDYMVVKKNFHVQALTHKQPLQLNFTPQFHIVDVGLFSWVS